MVDHCIPGTNVLFIVIINSSTFCCLKKIYTLEDQVGCYLADSTSDLLVVSLRLHSMSYFAMFQLKCVGPKLVPFFKTVSIYFVLFGDAERSSVFFCIAKCLPIVSLILFVLLHGMSLNEYYRYSRLILIGLISSCIGDAFLVWKHAYMNFECGLLMFAIAQFSYAKAFGFRPFSPYAGAVFVLLGFLVYSYLKPGMTGMMEYLAPFYLILICVMGWRAVARVQFFDDLWTWTKLCGCAGALCFMISDLTIAVDLFRFSVPFAHQIIMVTYYAAQFGISLSVVDSQVEEVIRIQTQDQSLDYKSHLEYISGHLHFDRRSRVFRPFASVKQE